MTSSLLSVLVVGSDLIYVAVVRFFDTFVEVSTKTPCILTAI